MSIVYAFSQSINDPIQLDSYLRTNLSGEFNYVIYTVDSGLLDVSVNVSISRSTVANLLNTYSDPSQLTYPGIRTNVGIFSDNFTAYGAGPVNLNSNFTLNNNFTIFGVPTPTINSDVVNKAYVDSISAGIALGKSVQTFNVLVDSVGISVNGSNQLQISSSSIGTGLSGGNGTSIAVNSSQTQITQVGSLTSLTVVGSLTAQSGLNAYGNVITNVANPVNNGDAVNLGYIDDLITNAAGTALSAVSQVLNVNVDGFSISVNGSNQLQLSSTTVGTGLSGGDGVSLTVNSSQTQVTQIGTLTSLNVSGPTYISNTTESNSLISGALRIAGGTAVTKKLYVGGLIYAQSGLSANNSIISLVADPIVSTDAANKNYVDSLIVSAGDGLSENSNPNTFSVNVDNSSIEIYNNTLRVASGLAGTGLSGGSGSALSVNSSQTQIVSVGMLTSLSVSGISTFSNTTDSSSVSTGSVIVTGGVAIGKNLFISGAINLLNTTDSSALTNGSLIVSGGASFAKNVQIGGNLNMNSGQIINLANPSLSTDAANKGYVDSVIVTAGNGLNKSGTNLNVNLSQSFNSLQLGGTFSGSPALGVFLQGNGTFTDNSTPASAVVTTVAFTAFSASTLVASNTSITTTNAATLYVEGPPVAGTNQTITNAYSVWVPNGDVRIDGNLIVSGNINSPILSAFISESYSTATNAGGFSSGSWVTRALNTSSIDSGVDVTLASNQMTFGSGMFLLEISAPAYAVGIHAIRLQNVGSNTTVEFGTTSSATDFVQTRSFIKCKITVMGSEVLEVQHQCEKSNNLDGLGVSTGFPGMTEVFTTVYIQKLE